MNRGGIAILGLMVIIVGLLGAVPPIIKYIGFNVGCESYLKSAGDSPTVELALPELETAIKYLEDNDLTDGFSHLIIKNRQADVGYWFERLEALRADLQTIDENSTKLERSNVLMKVREVLLDDGDSGVSVTHPPHIHTFPNQWLWVIFGSLGWIAVCFGSIIIFVGAVE